MNADKMIADLALEALGHRKGDYQYIGRRSLVELRRINRRRLGDRVSDGADPAPFGCMDAVAPFARRRSSSPENRPVLKISRATCRTRDDLTLSGVPWLD